MILPEEISDEILSYLNVCDIKEASLVTKHWYTLIGRTKSCMEKLCLKPKKSYENLEFFENILDSTRMYQKLDMTDRYNDIKKNTKYLRLMRDVVTKFAETLVSLKISNDLIIKEDLPKLRKLEFDSSYYKTLIAPNGLLTKTKGLDKLTLDFWLNDEKSLKYLRMYLTQNDSLKVLKLFDNRLFKGLSSDNVRCRLEELNINFEDPVPYEFLRAHASSLQVAECSFDENVIQFFMTTFPKLHTLTVRVYWYHSKSNELSFNTSIKKLWIKISSLTYHFGAANPINELIQKVQNLEEFEIDTLNSQLLPTLFNCQKLKTVKYRNGNLTQQDRDAIQIHENIEFIHL